MKKYIDIPLFAIWGASLIFSALSLVIFIVIPFSEAVCWILMAEGMNEWEIWRRGAIVLCVTAPCSLVGAKYFGRL